jgi:DNA-binding MarR family transcriptional regulator
VTQPGVEPSASATEPLMRLSRTMTAIVARTLSDVEDTLSVPQLRILVMLYFESPLDLTTIGRNLNVDRSNASRPCERLVAAGLLRRREDPRDRRHVALSLTPKGRRLVDSVMSRRREIIDALVHQLGEEDQEHLFLGVTALLAVVDRSGDRADVALTPGSIVPWIR